MRAALLNRIRDEIRRAGRRPDREELDPNLGDAQPSPLEEAIGNEALERYERALARLRPEEQDVIIGRVELGFSNEELAAALGKPTPDAARKAAQRALVRLAEEMSRENLIPTIWPMSPSAGLGRLWTRGSSCIELRKRDLHAFVFMQTRIEFRRSSAKH